MDPILDCHWRDQDGGWALTVGLNGTDWELFAAGPQWSESLPFAGPDEVRRLAQALLDLPADPEPYECAWRLARKGRAAAGEQHGRYATLTVGLDPADDHRPYLAYRSFHDPGHTTGPGFEVICEDPPVDHLRAQAHAFLTNCPGPRPRWP
ncbi:hypothetical protein AB0O91_02775 [Kitasatospora sp. NPDC089797]|uniref:hypothetical protein n=1 Tax=Kitasatospora sp. NPDC089797 TaxID=3155298 RepID=UPI003443B8E8